MASNHSLPKRRLTALRATALLCASCMLPLCAAQAADREAQAKAAWREKIARTPVPAEGCFSAGYPAIEWVRVDCTVAPQVPYVPRGGRTGYTVGNGNDYAAVVTSLITSTTGTFPKIKGLKSETDGGTPNSYSLQINSQFFSSPTCSGASNPNACLGWQQFVYASDYREAFMQYWLINYNNTCPAGWFSYSNDCYTNSQAVTVPQQAITQLGNLTLTGAAGGATDTLTMMTETNAYHTYGADTVVDLAAYWMQSEFNVIGDGGGSSAVFNKGTSLTVNIALATSSTAAPLCKSHDGTTGETNNLNLGRCTVSGGATPSVKFIEKN